jgi:hypothetical protein
MKGREYGGRSMAAMRHRLLGMFFLLLLGVAQADTLVNWQLGYEVDVPPTWLRQEGGANGTKLSSEDVRLDVVPFSGSSQSSEIARLHKETKAQGYQFKTERSFTVHEVPAHEMIFYRGGRYLIYYVLMSGQRGFLLSLRSDGTDSDAFHEAQDIISNFRVVPLR